jgi:NAD(P)-dependent dehydrogenase (short-subunit alcohol dehydrogenase family)
VGALKDKVAVITGAGSGMGRAAAEVFVREGAKVILADISGAESETASKLGDHAIAVRCDVTDESHVAEMRQAAYDTFGKLDAVLNVAGIASGAMLESATLEDYERLMAVNLRGVFLGTKHAIRAMRAAGNGGSIVNWASLGGLNATPHTSVYSAGSGSFSGVGQSLVCEWRGYPGRRRVVGETGLELLQRCVCRAQVGNSTTHRLNGDMRDQRPSLHLSSTRQFRPAQIRRNCAR